MAASPQDNPYGAAPKDQPNRYVPPKQQVWQELEITPPRFPEAGHLTAIPLDLPGVPFDYALDFATLRSDRDGVIRYVVVITSPTGARNVLYEGLRCKTGESKTYAYGTLNEWTDTVYSRWEPLIAVGNLAYRDRFYSDYFCHDLGESYSREQIIARFRNNQRFNKGNAE